MERELNEKYLIRFYRNNVFQDLSYLIKNSSMLQQDTKDFGEYIPVKVDGVMKEESIKRDKDVGSLEKRYKPGIVSIIGRDPLSKDPNTYKTGTGYSWERGNGN